MKPTLVGNPDAEVYTVRMDEAILAWGDPLLRLDEFDSSLETDASFFPREKVEGQAWQLNVNGRAYRLRRKGRRYGQGPTVAEMRAIVEGMKQALERGAHCLVIKTDNRWSAHVLIGLWKARKPHTIPVADQALELIEKFDAVAVVHTRTRNIRKVDRAARQAARSKRTDVLEKMAGRLLEMNEVIRQAKWVPLRRKEDHWVAHQRFRVTVSPPSCTCGSWSRKWMAVPLVGKRARRLLCKHIVAAASRESIQDPEKLLALSREAKS